MSMTQDKHREIIADFADEIRKRRMQASPVESTRIYFREGAGGSGEFPVYTVPLELLRFRKENGRISSSVKTHERLVGPLDSADSIAQDKLRQFLREKDPEKTDELKRLLLATGQREPGIITADGFLINGNRRKVALDELSLTRMKVVILPGQNDEGGPPTLKEIEQIENRYQLQAEGKAEYYAFDAALSIRDKETSGYSLDEQMRDDPLYKRMGEADFKKAVKKRRKEMLDPLDRIDDYLDTVRRPGEYSAVSKGLGDPEGRWQAFHDLSQSFVSKAKAARGLRTMGIDEDEAGQILQASYSVIRMRDVPTFGKLHTIMRDLHKYCKHGKQHLLKIATDVKHQLPNGEEIDAGGTPLPKDTVESKWKAKYKEEITRNLAKAREATESGGEKSAPLRLLEEALQKLNHGSMIVDNIEVGKRTEALRIAGEIKKRISELNGEIYERKKTAKSYGMDSGA